MLRSLKLTIHWSKPIQTRQSERHARLSQFLTQIFCIYLLQKIRHRFYKILQGIADRERSYIGRYPFVCEGRWRLPSRQKKNLLKDTAREALAPNLWCSWSAQIHQVSCTWPIVVVATNSYIHNYIHYALFTIKICYLLFIIH